MFSFTKRVDYALLALSYLTSASAPNEVRLVNTKEIAENYNIPIELLAKIMQVLARHELVTSYPGPTGGYRLTRPADQISVAEVVSVIDGHLAMIHCSNGNELGCEQFSRCTIRNPLTAIEDRMNELLQKMTVWEIARDTAPQETVPVAEVAADAAAPCLSR